MKLMKLNKEGFTLVELLAVIVVLAIIMIIAVPSVLKSMNNAKKGAFKIEAQKASTKAQEQYQTDQMMNALDSNTYKTIGGLKFGTSTTATNVTQYCYTLNDIGITSAGSYQGYVKVLIKDDDATAYYFVTLTDASFSLVNGEYETLSSKIASVTKMGDSNFNACNTSLVTQDDLKTAKLSA